MRQTEGYNATTRWHNEFLIDLTSPGFSRLSIFLSVPGLKSASSKLQICCKTTCLKVMASIFFDMAPCNISFVRDFLSFIAFSLTFLAGKNWKNKKINFCSNNYHHHRNWLGVQLRNWSLIGLAVEITSSKIPNLNMLFNYFDCTGWFIHT